MSVESISLVLNHSRSEGVARLVLIGVANHDGDGGAWPKIATLARYANCSERTVQRAIRELEDLGELVVHKNAGGTHTTRSDRRPNRYQLAVDKSVDNPQNGVTRVSPRGNDGVTDQVERGDKGVAHGVTTVSPEPSLNHPEPAAAAAVDRQAVENSLEPLVAAMDKAGFEAITYRVPTAKLQTIAELIERHGVPRLVDAAVRTTRPDAKIRHVSAFIPTWEGLRGRILKAVDAPKCPVCGRTETACMTSNASLAPDDRCHGTQGVVVVRRSS